MQLLLATALHESKLEYLKQHPTGPALGVYQMEPATLQDHWRWLQAGGSSFYDKWSIPSGLAPIPEKLVFNLQFATVYARIHYWRIPEALPEAGDKDGMWAYYKRYYNTPLGKATESQWASMWERNEAEIVA